MTIQEILKELDVEYLEGGHKHCRPGWIQIDCPFCGRDTHRYHLGYNLSLKYFNCWKCGAHFTDQVFVELGVGSKKAKELARGINIPEGTIKRERTRLSLKEPKGKAPMLAAHRRYLISRGFDPDELERAWKLEGIGPHTALRWRIYIPIYLKGKRVSWTTRSISPEARQRYLSASPEEESINHKSVVYGIDYCHHSVVICEGPTDAWKIGPGAGALFGTAFTPAQVLLLSNIPNRFVCFDSADAAQARAHELCGQLSMFPGNTENLLIDAKDPGSASSKEIRLIKKAAKL